MNTRHGISGQPSHFVADQEHPSSGVPGLALTMLLALVMIIGVRVGSAHGGACFDCTRDCCKFSKTTGVTACSCIRPSCLIFCNELCCPVVFEPGFNDTAGVDPDGRQILLSGHVECDEGAKFHLRLTVTQHGAVAEASTNGTCGAGSTPWEVTAHTEHFPGFIAGPALACGLGISDTGEATKATQWCREITLEEQ